MEVDNRLSERVAELTMQLKHQYQVVLMASTAYGEDKNATREMDHLGGIIKELEDAVVISQLESLSPTAKDTRRLL